MKHNPPARGHLTNSGRRRITIEFDQELFTSISLRAQREGTSFNEQVQLLCEWGLESEKTFG